MAKLIVKIHIPGPAEALRKDIEADRELKDSWFSPQDGDRILVDDAYVQRSVTDDSFLTFEFVAVVED